MNTGKSRCRQCVDFITQSGSEGISRYGICRRKKMIVLADSHYRCCITENQVASSSMTADDKAAGDMLADAPAVRAVLSSLQS